MSAEAFCFWRRFYYLQSIPHPDQHYVGLTTDVDTRLTSHNAGQSPHTSKYRPWKILTYDAFADAKAAAFEKSLNTVPGGERVVSARIMKHNITKN